MRRAAWRQSCAETIFDDRRRLVSCWFGALAVATAFQAAPLSVAIPVVVLAAVLILRIKGNGKIKGDAAIALISTTSLALGVMVISMTTGMNTDVYNYMFGSIWL